MNAVTSGHRARAEETTSVALDSAALARLIAEVRNDAVSAPTAYNRTHNRHNR
ncbi:YhhA family cyclophane-containing RiPP [Sphingomonas sp. CLY1604]|uniref:YhhA family cyclophane-containing RiPP n=1 Tax=Sphingomonas sp. CLY1604 TaxID=3457786 RepID=UPI003FD835AD